MTTVESIRNDDRLSDFVRWVGEFTFRHYEEPYSAEVVAAEMKLPVMRVIVAWQELTEAGYDMGARFYSCTKKTTIPKF